EGLYPEPPNERVLRRRRPVGRHPGGRNGWPHGRTGRGHRPPQRTEGRLDRFNFRSRAAKRRGSTDRQGGARPRKRRGKQIGLSAACTLSLSFSFSRLDLAQYPCVKIPRDRIEYCVQEES